MHGAQSTLCLTSYRRVSKAYKYFRMRCAHGRNSPIRHLLSGFSEGDRCRCMKEDFISKIAFSIFLLLEIPVCEKFSCNHTPCSQKTFKVDPPRHMVAYPKERIAGKGVKRDLYIQTKKKDSQKVAYKVVESEVWKHGNQFAESNSLKVFVFWLSLLI